MERRIKISMRTMRKTQHKLLSTPLWEKLAGLVGFVLFCFMVVFLIHAAIEESDSTPAFRFSVTGSEAAGEQFMVFVEIMNTSNKTVADLHVEASLRSADGNTGFATLSLDYVPQGSTRSMVFYFADDPAQGELSFRALAFSEP